MVTVRKMTEADLDFVVRLEQELFTDAWSEQSLLDTLHERRAMICVAEGDEGVNGYCIVYYVLDEAEIARIGVNPNMRRCGVGSRMLDEVCDWCRQKNISRLLLDVRESNVGAQVFYTQYGFLTDGKRKNFYEFPKEDAVLMSLSL